MNRLDDLLISKIRKVTLATLKDSKLNTGLWATKDNAGNWVLVCSTCIMAWNDEDVDQDSTKLDKLIGDGFEQKYLERFEDAEWFSAITPSTSRIVRANRMPLMSARGVAFEYSLGWSKTTDKKKAHYRPEHLQLAQDIVGEAEMKYMIYPNGKTEDGREKVWLLIYEGRRPFMIVSNLAEIENAEENTCPTTT